MQTQDIKMQSVNTLRLLRTCIGKLDKNDNHLFKQVAHARLGEKLLEYMEGLEDDLSLNELQIGTRLCRVSSRRCDGER